MSHLLELFVSICFAGTIDYTHVFYVRPGYSTFISSPNLVNATVSYDPTGTTPLYLFLEPTQWRLSFTMPTNNGGVPVILNVDDVCGNHYKLYAMPRGSFYFNIAYEGDFVKITLENDEPSQLPDGLKVCISSKPGLERRK